MTGVTEDRARVVLAAALLAMVVLAGQACQGFEAHSGTSKASSPRQASKDEAVSRFLRNVPGTLRLPAQDDEVGWRVLSDYGAVFVVQGGATPPPMIVFPGERAVTDWQARLKTRRLKLGGTILELQEPAARALLDAQHEAQARGLEISPRGKDAAARSFADTARLWTRRVESGLVHWVKAGRLTRKESERIRALSPLPQAAAILNLENEGMFFGRKFSKSILYSMAVPGTSQHISMLALDVREHSSKGVRALLARHGWYQTVLSDLPHFTFLGVPENELSGLGLKKAQIRDRTFWIPDLAVPRRGKIS